MTALTVNTRQEFDADIKPRANDYEQHIVLLARLNYKWVYPRTMQDARIAQIQSSVTYLNHNSMDRPFLFDDRRHATILMGRKRGSKQKLSYLLVLVHQKT
jgi:hypothetical protein